MKSELSEQEKLENWFRHKLYNIERLASEDYQLADLLKDYIDKKFELILDKLNHEK